VTALTPAEIEADLEDAKERATEAHELGDTYRAARLEKRIEGLKKKLSQLPELAPTAGPAVVATFEQLLIPGIPKARP
jgi:hypothetical protein